MTKPHDIPASATRAFGRELPAPCRATIPAVATTAVPAVVAAAAPAAATTAVPAAAQTVVLGAVTTAGPAVAPVRAVAGRTFPAVALALAVAVCLTLAPVAAKACTLWAAAGERAGGGTLLNKNRDNNPSQKDTLLLTAPEKGRPYLGLYADIDGRQTLVGGVNRAGLSLVSATAGSVPKELRRVASHPKGLTAKVLGQLASVDEALEHLDWFSGHAPVIYLLADARKIAWIEIGPEGRIAWRAVDQGDLAHTNHYLPEGLVGENRTIGQSSRVRLERIQALQAAAASPLTSQACLAMSRDQNAGPDDSIFRTGSTPQKTRTLATFLVRMPAAGPGEVLVSIFDDPAAVLDLRLTLDDAFWARAVPGRSVPVLPAP